MDPVARKGPQLVEAGEWAGWRTWTRETFDVRSGPFYHRKEADGTMRCAFRVERKHLNGLDIVHGGCLVTFADHALFVFAHDQLRGGPSVTVSLNSEFVGAAREGDLIEAKGEVIKAGGSMIFVRGLLVSGDQPLLNFSGTIKKIKPKDPAASNSTEVD